MTFRISVPEEMGLSDFETEFCYFRFPLPSSAPEISGFPVQVSDIAISGFNTLPTQIIASTFREIFSKFRFKPEVINFLIKFITLLIKNHYNFDVNVYPFI